EAVRRDMRSGIDQEIADIPYLLPCPQSPIECFGESVGPGQLRVGGRRLPPDRWHRASLAARVQMVLRPRCTAPIPASWRHRGLKSDVPGEAQPGPTRAVAFSTRRDSPRPESRLQSRSGTLK